MGKVYKATQLNKLTNDINKYIAKAMTDDLARNVYNIMKKWILEEVYSKYEPLEYKRTYALLNSLTVSPIIKSGNIMSINIYIPNKVINDIEHEMQYDVSELGLAKGDNPTLSEVMQILEEGLNRYRPESNVMENTIQELKTTNIILKSLMSYLKSKGFKVV